MNKILIIEIHYPYQNFANLYFRDYNLKGNQII